MSGCASRRLCRFRAAFCELVRLPAESPWDAQAAGKAGVRTIGVMSGGWSKAELEKAGCVEVYRDVAELLANYDRSVLGER